MKLTNETLTILKNMSDLNQNILVKEGNQLRSVTASKTVLAEAEITETFDTQFGIYNLSSFLATLNLFDELDLTFEDKFVSIGDGKQRVKYWYSDPSLLITPPDKKLALPSEDIEFVLTKDTLAQIKKAAGVLEHDRFALVGSNGEMKIVVSDPNNKTANTFELDVDVTKIDPDAEFNMIFAIENLKFLPGDYDVKISSKCISEFTGSLVKYWVALDKDSSYTA